jgi:uncharacterized protein
MPVATTALYAGILALVIVALGFNVTVHRWKFRVMLGDGSQPLLQRVIRMHGNSIENIPFCLLLMGLYELDHGMPSALHAAGIALIVGRVMYVAPLWVSGGPNAIRATGVTITWVTTAALAILNLVQIV